MDEQKNIAATEEYMKAQACIPRSASASNITHIVPTVGRVVWYWPAFGDGDKNMDHDGEQPLRADVCHVNPDGSINLCVNDAAGNGFKRPNITLHQGDAEGCSLPRPFATWMPYQKGQAAKSDQLKDLLDMRQTALEVAQEALEDETNRLQLDMLREQVRELRMLNDTREITLNAMKANGFSASGAISGGVQLCAQQAQQTEVTSMRPHQMRMREERDELSIRLMNLRDFTAGREFAALEETEQELMHEQAEAMQRYLACLQDRIALFNEQQDGL